MNEDLARYLAAQEGLNPEVVTMALKAMSPKTPWAGTIGEGGETKFTFMPPETRAAKEKEKAPAGPGQPAKAGGVGFAPAIAAMGAPTGEPISAASLRGLTPEQIMGVMGTEAEAERLRQGTIGQLMELPYRQALTERAMRPDLTPTFEQRQMLAQIQKSMNPLQQFTLFKGLLEYQTNRIISGGTLEELRELYKTHPFLFRGAPKDIVEQVTKEEHITKMSEGAYWRVPGGEAQWVGAGKPVPAGAEMVPRTEVREVSRLPEERFERLKEMDAMKARELIARKPKFAGNKEYVHAANRDSKDTTLYVWEEPGMLGFGGGARKVKLPKGMVAGHFEPDMTERLAAGETIGPFKHPTTGARIMLQLVDDEVKIVK